MKPLLVLFNQLRTTETEEVHGKSTNILKLTSSLLRTRKLRLREGEVYAEVSDLGFFLTQLTREQCGGFGAPTTRAVKNLHMTEVSPLHTWIPNRGGKTRVLSRPVQFKLVLFNSRLYFFFIMGT